MFGGQVAGAGARRRRPHRRATTGTCTRCTRTSCGPATRTSRSSTTSTASATAAASRPAASSRSSTARPIFNLAASFQVDEAGPDHHDARCPTCPAPRRCRRSASGSSRTLDRFSAEHRRLARPRAPDRLAPGRGPALARPRAAARARRRTSGSAPNGTLPDDPLLHACVVAYASDLTLLDTATLPHAIGHDGRFMIASLDHAMWFHRPFRADEWLLYHQTSPSASGARGLARGLHLPRATARSRSP